MKKMGSTGIILVQALVVAVLVSIVASLLWRVAMGRRTLAARQSNQSQAKAVAEAAYHRASQCLRDLDWQCTAAPAAPGDCTACGDPTCGAHFGSYDLVFPGDLRAYRVRVEVRSDAGRCRLDATCESCL